MATARLKEKYRTEVRDQMVEKFGYKNVNQVPKLEKVVLNMSVAEAIQNGKVLDVAASELQAISGQKPVITKAKKSIAAFKLREGMAIGCKVTLRGARMWEFYDRLVSLAIPRIRDIAEGRLDALINNAAISPKTAEGTKIPSLAMPYADWVHVFNVNLFAAVALVQGLKDYLLASRGAVVNITSIVGTRVHPFASAAYACSKAALGALTREMASELGASGVQVNAVSPGEIETSILSPGTDDIVERQIPMRRMGQPKEVAELLFFLCSDKARYITGSEMFIDGGQHV